MPFHVKRTDTSKLETLQQYNGIRTTRWVEPPAGKSVLEIQTTHTPTALQQVPKDKNYLTPPYHRTHPPSSFPSPYHHHQQTASKPRVNQGTGTKTNTSTSNKAATSSPSQTKQPHSAPPTRNQSPIHIPARARHTFRVDDSHDGPCTIEISTLVSPRSPNSLPEACGTKAKFFRNISTYHSDSHQQNVSPSQPQLLLMLDSAEVSLAFDWGPDWLMRGVSYAFGVVVGRWVGGYVLGYEASYAEYWVEDGGSGRRKDL